MNYKKIKSYEDACKALNIQPLADEVFNAFPKAERKNVKAYHQLTVITRAINEGWEPDFSNREQRKYEPYMYTDNAGLAFANTGNAPSITNTYVGSRLCFPDYERATFAVETFKELYKAYFLPGKWEDEAQEPANGAAGKEPGNKGTDGGATHKHEDDMSDAPEFLQKVVEICKEQIEPLCSENDERGIILIAVEDNVKDEDGTTNCCTTVAAKGKPTTLAKALNRFLQHEESKPIVKRAFLFNKIDKIISEGMGVIDDFIKHF